MNITMSLSLEVLSILVFGSIIFVWGIRYNNIKDEFKHFQLPNWLRDLVGILKLSFAIMLFSKDLQIVQIGASGIALLMVAALVTHLRLKSEPARMLPSFALLCACVAIVYMSNQLLIPPAWFVIYLGIAVQILLFLVFAVGGSIRLVQPIVVLAKRMRWVSYFSPKIVRSIALVEVICGVGILLPLILTDSSFSFLFYSGCLLMATMVGAVITHLVIGDYRQIIGNLALLGMIYFVTFPV